MFFSQQVFQKALADRRDDPALQKLVRSGDICDLLQFADMVFRPPIELGAALRRLRHSVGKFERRPERLKEILLSLLGNFVTLSHDHLRLAESVPAKRATTRRLLLGRLQRTKEMIDDLHGRPLTLDELAGGLTVEVSSHPLVQGDFRRFALGVCRSAPGGSCKGPPAPHSAPNRSNCGTPGIREPERIRANVSAPHQRDAARIQIGLASPTSGQFSNIGRDA